MRNYLILLCLAFLLSCNENTRDYKVFRYNQINAANSLDPAFARSQTNIWAVNHLYNTLIDLNDDLEIIPAIAESWTVSEDGLRYTFKIRQGIKFHNNDCFDSDSERELDARDVQYSLERIIDPNLNSPGSWIFKGKVADENPFEVLDDTSFVINLKEPFRPFLGLLSMKYCSIVPKEAIEYYKSDFRKNPVGSGPFLFKKWIENRALYLIRYDEYFEGPVSIEGVKASYIQDKKIAFLELLNGNLDFVSGLESSFINELLTDQGDLQSEKKDLIKFYKAPYLNTEYIGVNMNSTKGSALSNVNFRKALNYSIDKTEMMKVLRNNVGKAAHSGFIPRGLPAFDYKNQIGYKYNIDSAQHFLTLSKYDRDIDAPIKIHTNNDYLDIITFVARQWQIIGVKVEIVLMESALLRSGMRSGDIDLFRASWIADYPDEENFLSLFYSKNGAPPNYTRFSNDLYDQLYEKSLNENNDSLRKELYQSMNRIIIEQCPVIFLFYDETALFYNKRMIDPSVNGINLLNVRQLSIDD